jgi:YlmC/YmxH family sporulation protein
MRWSELIEKECVDMLNGERIDHFSRADLRFHPQTGKIEAILIPASSSWFKKQGVHMEISWSMVKKVGPEMVIIDSAARR